MVKLSSPLLLVILGLMGIGLVQIYSSSFIFAIENYNDGLFFFKRQLLFSVFALVVMIATSSMPFRLFARFGWLIWVVGVLGVVATFIPGLGVRVGGAIRWLQLPGGFRFEPSEILKFSFGLFFGSLLVRQENFLKKLHWLVLLALYAVPMVLLLKQPDFGSFSIIFFVGVGLLFAFGLKWRYVFAGAIAVIPAFYFLVMAQPYRRARVMAFLDPWTDPEQKGFQVIQSMMSFRTGGVSGVGLGQGQGKLFFLPEAHTDFTAAVFGEEMGFIGFVVILALYAFIVFRGFQIAIRVENVLGKAFALGLSMTFALSVFINLGVVMGMVPTKGLALPFLSYGGSSLISMCFFFGLLLSLERGLAEEPSSGLLSQALKKRKSQFSIQRF